MALNPDIKTARFPRLQEEAGAITIEPALLKAGTVSLKGSELTVNNAELSNLIQSKLAAAAQLVKGRNAASDVDAGVTIKVHF